MNERREGWDRRAWFVGLVVGNVCAVVAALANYPPAAQRLDRLLRIRIGETDGAQLVGIVFVLSCLLLLPCLLSGIARRRTFLWGLLPVGAFWLWINLEDAAENGWREVGKDFWLSVEICTASLVITSGPVSLVRYAARRRREKRQERRREYAAQREAASRPAEGVWPPPPTYFP